MPDEAMTRHQNTASRVDGVHAAPKRPSAAAVQQAKLLFGKSKETLRQRDFLMAGIHQEQVARLANAGVIQRIQRGHYRLPDAEARG